MKRLAFGAALLLAACAAPTAPVHRPAVPPASHDGEPCVTEDGRSGYMVTAGIISYCQAA